MIETSLIDLEINDAPPMEDEPPKRTRRVTGEKSTKIPTVTYRKGTIAKGFVQIYGAIGVGLMAFDPKCGSAIIENAEACAESLETLARDNPAVRKVLLSLIAANAWSGVLMAHAPIILAIATHHIPAVEKGMEKMGERLMGGLEQQMGTAE